MADYDGSRFGDVWRAVRSDPYDVLPEGRIRLRDVLRWGALRRIHASARRTLRTPDDLLPPFDKLAHPFGICLRGTWRITEASRYTGYFRKGSTGLLIARASENLGENRPGHRRFLGLAGKLYPTADPGHMSPLVTANFLMSENLLGSFTPHYLDAVLSTDLLPAEAPGKLGQNVALAALVGVVFAVADRVRRPTQSLVRQLYPVAELGELEPGRAVAPAVMRLVPSDRNGRVDATDLREELRMEHHPHGVRYEIQVAARRAYFSAQEFMPLGEVHFSESILSCSCDHRLHFRHPPYRKGDSRPETRAPRKRHSRTDQSILTAAREPFQSK